MLIGSPTLVHEAALAQHIWNANLYELLKRTRLSSAWVLDTSSRWPHLVGGGELRPRFIGPAVVVLRVRGLNVLVEAQDLPGLELGHRGPLGELRVEEDVAVAADYEPRSLSVKVRRVWNKDRALTFLVSLRLISQRSSRRSASFLAAGSEKIEIFLVGSRGMERNASILCIVPIIC